MKSGIAGSTGGDGGAGGGDWGIIGGKGTLALIPAELLPNRKLGFGSIADCALASNVAVSTIADRRLADTMRDILDILLIELLYFLL
jgi:hypothetical protein